MGMVESPPRTARSQQEPFGIQFSIFLANRVGQLKDLLGLFAEKDVKVLGLSVVDSTDWGVIRIVFDDPDKARGILKARGAGFTESVVLPIELADQNALAQICSCLLSAEINLHFAYPLTIRSNENPVMVFHVDDYVVARQVITRHGFTILGAEDLIEGF